MPNTSNARELLPSHPSHSTYLARVEALMQRCPSMSAGGSAQAVVAAEALSCGEASFWTVASYSNSVAGYLLEASLRLRDVGKAIDYCNATFGGHDFGEARFLDTLLPLNDAAVKSLKAAYGGSGTFRTNEELYRKTERYEQNAVSVAGARADAALAKLREPVAA